MTFMVFILFIFTLFVARSFCDLRRCGMLFYETV